MFMRDSECPEMGRETAKLTVFDEYVVSAGI